MRKSQMKITKSRLKQIITEELQNILAEVDPTKVLDPVEMAKKRQADRETRSERIRKRAEHLERARRLMGILYPLTYRDEMVFTINLTSWPDAVIGSAARKTPALLISTSSLLCFSATALDNFSTSIRVDRSAV